MFINNYRMSAVVIQANILICLLENIAFLAGFAPTREMRNFTVGIYIPTYTFMRPGRAVG